jgi:hypothetical protein
LITYKLRWWGYSGIDWSRKAFFPPRNQITKNQKAPKEVKMRKNKGVSLSWK